MVILISEHTLFFQVSFTVCRSHSIRFLMYVFDFEKLSFANLCHIILYMTFCWLVILIIIIMKWYKQQFLVSIHTEFSHTFFSLFSIQQCLDILYFYRIMISSNVYFFSNRKFFCSIGRCSWVSRSINSIDKTWE